MFSVYVSRLADLLVEYSLRIKKGQEVMYRSSYEALPLAVEVVRAVASRGAHPIILFSDEVVSEAFYRYATPDALKHLSKVERLIAENIDASISVVSSTHTRYLASIDPERMRMVAEARRPLTEIFMRRSSEGSLRWVVTAYPTRALAQEAGMSFLDYADFVFRALKVDREDPVESWRKQSEMQEKIVKLLSKVSELHYVGPDLDLTVKVEGRVWVNDDGEHNMPGGEVFTAPVEDGVDGYIRYTYPAVWQGRMVENVKLWFRNGVVVRAEATHGADFLRKMLETDEGAKRLGEAAFGLNYDIDRYTKSILFDEKIGGTVHFALGAAYPECGGKNISAIHWDMIRDMRGSEVYADGELIYRNGRFLGLE